MKILFCNQRNIFKKSINCHNLFGIDIVISKIANIELAWYSMLNNFLTYEKIPSWYNC